MPRSRTVEDAFSVDLDLNDLFSPRVPPKRVGQAADRFAPLFYPVTGRRTLGGANTALLHPRPAGTAHTPANTPGAAARAAACAA